MDYSTSNAAGLVSALGLPASHVQVVSYVPPDAEGMLRRYWDAPKQYDVAFVGAASPRRLKILAALRQRGVSVLVVRSFAEERDRMLASAKLLVNIHASEDYTVYETLRCTHVLFTGLPVVSEASQLPLGDFLEAEAEMVPYAQLVDAVVRAIANYDERRARLDRLIRQSFPLLFHKWILYF